MKRKSFLRNKYLNTLVLFTSISSPLLAEGQKPHAKSNEEALFVRRIVEFWKDRETDILKSQIAEFLKEYPDSEFRDNMLVILGDTYWKDKEFSDALQAYDSIQSPNTKEKVFSQRMDSLYHLGMFQPLAEEIVSSLPHSDQPLANSKEELWVYYYAEAERNLAKHTTSKEEASKSLNASREQYQRLLNSSLAMNAKFGLAEVQASLGNYKEAVALYLNIAKEHPEKNEDALYFAAKIESRINPEQALAIFNEVQQFRGTRAEKASLNKAYLLHELKRYHDLIEEEQAFRSSISPQHQALLSYLLGKSHYALKQYDQAIAILQPLLDNSSNELKPYQQTILLTLITAAYQERDQDLVDQLASLYHDRYPNDPSYGKALYYKALTYKNQERYEEAANILTHLIQEYPQFSNLEKAKYERAMLLFRLGDWQDSREAFVSYILDYPQGKFYNKAISYIASASLKQLEAHPADEKKEQLVQDIKLALNTPQALHAKQRPRYLLLLGKTLHDLRKYSEAQSTLETYLQEYPEDPNIQKGRIALAMTYLAQQQYEPFIAQAKILLKNKELNEAGELNYQLYQAYLQLAAKDKNSEKSSRYLDKAAKHLYQAYLAQRDLVTYQNQLWLANYFYKNAQNPYNESSLDPLHTKEGIENALKARTFLEEALGVNKEFRLPAITEHNLTPESELLKLAHVYAWLDQKPQAIAVLRSLYEKQNAHPGWNWGYRDETIFALAYALTQTEDRDHAKELFSMSERSGNPYIANASKLWLSRFRFASIPDAQKQLKNSEVLTILQQLKDLQIKKSLSEEPVHIESAIEYAMVRSALEPQEKRSQHELFLLQRVKENFAGKEDLWSKDYHKQRTLQPNKELIYQAYISLIDGHIARLEAIQAQANNDRAEARAKLDLAAGIYKNLLGKTPALTRYVMDQAKLGLEETDALQSGLK